MYRPLVSPKGSKASLDDLVTSSLVSDLKSTGTNLLQQATTSQISNNSGSPTQQELLSHLVKKILDLEKENTALKEQAQNPQLGTSQQSQQQKVSSSGLPRQQDVQQSTLHQQQQEMQHLQSEVHRLRHQCRTAWQHVADIKAFLQDYGLVWVGGAPPGEDGLNLGDTADTAASATVAEPSKIPSSITQAPSPAGMPFDVKELQQCLDELNDLAGDGIGQLRPLSTAHSKGKGHSSASRTLGLYTPEPIKLVIYSDGIQLHDAPARPYDDPTVDAILIDIFDGYFPSVLRKDFSDGIPIQLVDRSSMSVAAAAAAAAVSRGSGFSKGRVHSFDDLQQATEPHPPGRSGASEFLQKLPKTVISNQQVVPVRSAVADYLTGSSATTTTSGSLGTRLSRASSGGGRVYIRSIGGSRRSSRDIDNSSNPTSPGATGGSAGGMHLARTSSQKSQQKLKQLTTLQVKSEDGKRTFVLKLPYTATISSLRAMIDNHRVDSGIDCKICQQRAAAHDMAQQTSPDCRYELRSAFPTRVHRDNAETLESAGLTPSATLFMQHC